MAPTAPRTSQPSVILIAEDETLTRMMLAEELQAEGHTVVEAINADEALSILRHNTSIDLLFTDVNMPGSLDGLALARLARAERSGMKVIIASGHVLLSDWVEEADAIFAKPFDIQRLVMRIKQVLQT